MVRAKNFIRDILKDGLISVILAVWKPDISQLKQCIDSIIEQTYSNLEIIIIYQEDPNFDKKFYELLDKYSDARLKVLNSSIIGISDAANIGINHAHGQYIARIDADDLCEKDRFEKQLKFKKENNCDVVGCWAYSISNDGKIIAKIKFPVENEEIRKNIMLHNFIIHSSTLIDKKIFDDVGLYDTNLKGSEDYDLWFRALLRGYRLGNVPEFLVRLRENPNSLTRGEKWRNHRITSMKVRNRAIFQYRFWKLRDIFYYFLTPISFFMSPRILMNVKRKSRWFESQ